MTYFKNRKNRQREIFLMGDMNARIQGVPIPMVVEVFGEDIKNNNRETLKTLAVFNKLKVTNTFTKNIYYIAGQQKDLQLTSF